MKKNSYQKYLDKKKVNPKPEKCKYSACMTGYYIEEPSQIVRMTCAICDLTTDKMVDMAEFWGDSNLDSAIDESFKLMNKYGIKEIHQVNQPVLLEKCPCGNCDGYLTNYLTKGNIAKGLEDSLHNSKKN